MLINKYPVCCFNNKWHVKLWNVFHLLMGVGVFDKNLKSVDLNEYICIQDGIIVIIVLIFMIFSTCCCLRIAASRGSLGQRGRGE